MGSGEFRFKQFSIEQDAEVFPVGTDGVLLGAWVRMEAVRKALDIGTGTGVIALMLAQRSEANIHTLDLDLSSCALAKKNAAQSPWPNQIEVFQNSLQEFSKTEKGKYDLLVSNPPFFTNSFRPSNQLRDRSRHNHTLPFEKIIEAAEILLNKKGHLSVILPIEEGQRFTALAENSKFYPQRITAVKPLPKQPAKRLLLEFGRKEIDIEKFELVINDTPRGKFTEAYQELTKDFYLAF